MDLPGTFQKVNRHRTMWSSCHSDRFAWFCDCTCRRRKWSVWWNPKQRRVDVEASRCTGVHRRPRNCAGSAKKMQVKFGMTLFWKFLFTFGLSSAPQIAVTSPSTRLTLRTVLLSLSAKNTESSSCARAMPEGCAKLATSGSGSLRFSSTPLPTILTHVPRLYSLETYSL